MTAALITERRHVEWRDLSPAARGEFISCAWIGSDGRYWPLTGLGAGTEGAFVTGAIDGMVHVPFEGVWTSPAYGPPRFERTVDSRREISLNLGLASSTGLGWINTESRFWNGCKNDATGYWSLTTRTHGQLWIPMQLAESVKCALADDPMLGGMPVAVHEILLAADGEPRWRRPPGFVGPFVSRTGKLSGVIRIANRGTRPAWPLFFVDAPGRVWLGDGPNAFVHEGTNPLDDWPRLEKLFGIPFFDEWTGLSRRTRDAHMVEVPEMFAGEHAVIDSDPTHRIAITATDPVDNLVKKFIRNSELLNWLLSSYGDTGLPLLQRFKGQGFSVPIPPRSSATIPVKHERVGGKIWCQLDQVFDSALA